MSTEMQVATKGFVESFESAKNQNSLAKYFDKDETQNVFTQVVIRAVQENPNLLNADRTSLFLACQEAAQDRLLPDGKDGALVVYNTRSGDRWIKKVQWQPMIGGLRRKLSEHGFHGLRAELVYKEDRFVYEKGDDPKIIHQPDVFADRGPLVGAYAIVTDTNTGIVYRDSMTKDQLDAVKAKSRTPDSGPWKDFPEEMYRKTMARRLVKQLPLISHEFSDILKRDDTRNFAFSAAPAASTISQQVQADIRNNEPIEGEVEKPKPTKAKKKKVAKKKVAKKPEPEPEPDVSDMDELDEMDEYSGVIDEDDPLENIPF
jgi:recombination protein RecT